MSKVAVIYWSQTGNTETMANAVCEGAKGAGADAELFEISSISPEEAAKYDALAIGCPAMGDEELDEGDVQPFWDEVKSRISGKPLLLFGSYDWGDGQWMRTWCEDAKAAGASLVMDEGQIANNTPEDEDLAACREAGAKLA